RADAELVHQPHLRQVSPVEPSAAGIQPLDRVVDLNVKVPPEVEGDAGRDAKELPGTLVVVVDRVPEIPLERAGEVPRRADVEEQLSDRLVVGDPFEKLLLHRY